MLSISKLYKVKLPKFQNPYTGKNTQELNKRQNYYNLHKKPQETEQKLPTPKNTADELSRQSE